MEHYKIIIVGGGLNGLGCAKRFQENGADFRLITEDIGGRIKTSPDGETNYGAYYVTADCHNILPYIEKVNLMHFAKAHFHRGQEHYHAYSLRMLKHIPAGIKLLRELFKFRSHVQKIRKQALDVSYQKLIEADPYLKKFYHQKAADYIKEKGLEDLTKEYLEQFLWAAYFTNPREVSAAIFLAVLDTIIVPSWSFKFNFGKLTAPFRDKITLDSVVKVRRLDNQKFKIETKSGKAYGGDILVLATPMNIANQLVKPQRIKDGINVNYYHLRGRIKKEYNVPWYNFFPIEEEAAISREPNGTYLYFYGSKDNIAKYFDEREIIAKGEWRPALFFHGNEYINENPEPNLFLANDHNVAGTEDAFINGHYIASLVLKVLNKGSLN
ncbi:MAG: NAD(P)-binding protein [Candidatus Harrisonbacteria bacterium]|nr:NAD(P)-binding protein [Candidatus Harrisonbacteria bacterium]